jgi:hypothetical protein
MSQHIEIFAALAAPFANDEVRSRSQGGREFSYVTARTVMNRLDEVLGPANWWDEYTPMENAIICRLTIRLEDGTTLTKSDAGGFTTTADTSDYEKSGFSDAFKRAAVKFGVGRYLYGDGVPQSIREALVRSRREQAAASASAAPAPAPVESERIAAEPLQPSPRQSSSHDSGPSSAPKSGKALFAWVKERDEKLGVDLLRTLSDWGKHNHFPARMVQWSGEQVDQGHSEALRVLSTLHAENGAVAAAGPRR